MDRAKERLRGKTPVDPQDDEVAMLRMGHVRRVNELAADLGERYSPKRATFGGYTVYDQKQKAAIAQVTTFLSDLPRRVENGSGLILYGHVGTGKDHLLAAALYAACERYTCRWANAQELYGAMRDRMDSGGQEAQWLQKWATPQILGLSDPTPPAGELSAWRLELLYRLIDRRYRALKSTWVTINVASPEEADKRLSAPVFDRLQESATMVPCFWPSFRERKRP